MCLKLKDEGRRDIINAQSALAELRMTQSSSGKKSKTKDFECQRKQN
jgi:hypothetical protein